MNKKLVGVLGIIGLLAVAAGGLAIVPFDTTTQPQEQDGEVKFEMNVETPTTETSDGFFANYLVQPVLAETDVEDVELYALVMGDQDDTGQLAFQEDGDTRTIDEGETLDGASVSTDSMDFEEDDLRITFEMTDPDGNTIIDETSQDWTTDPTYTVGDVTYYNAIDYTFDEETLEEGTYEINVVLEAYM